MRLRFCPAKLILALTLLTMPVAAVTAEIADGEREFVQQLLDRQMFDLAEQFCNRRLNGYINNDDRAEWELILSECQLQHAWEMDADSRNGMISQTAQRITEFLRKNTPTAEKDILLRVRQIELLAAAGVMEAIVQAPLSSVRSADSPGSAAGSRANPRANGVVSPRPTVSPGPSKRKIPPGTTFALEAISQAQLLAEGLLKQIEQIRRDVDSDVVRTAREHIRMAQAQMMVTGFRLAPSEETLPLISQADDLAEQLAKSAADERMRFQARLMMADIQLEKNDFSAFKLRFGNVSSSATSADQKTATVAIKIRSLLKQGQPSDALLEYGQAVNDGLLISPELQTLRLQSLLQRLELLFQLDESKEQATLQSSTAAEFQRWKDQTIAATHGIWRQRCLRIAVQFDRVYQVGPETAAELEQVAELVDAGETKAARQVLNSLIQRPGTRRPKIRAALLLQSGQLAVQLREWNAAVLDLRNARQSSLEAKDIAGAAAADLLRVYAVGQQWNSKSSDGISEDTYLQAIDEHLATFADQPTIRQAQEWRARLLRTSVPLKSAEELLNLAAAELGTNKATNSTKDANAETAVASGRRLYFLCLAGDHLLEAIAKELPKTPAEIAEKEEKLNALSARFIRDSEQRSQDLASPDWAAQVYGVILETQQLGLNLRERIRIEADWQTIMADSQRLRTTLSDQLAMMSELTPQKSASAAADSEIGQLTRHAITICETLILLSGVRQLADAADYKSARASLSALPVGDRFRIVQQVRRQFTPNGKPAPGDAQLAHVLIGLIDSPPNEKAAWSTELRLTQLRLLRPLTAVVETEAVFDRCLNDLLTLPLTDSQISAVADVVAQSVSGSGPVSAEATSASRKFWQSVLKKTQPGRDSWLEASLQMAVLAESSGDSKEALKILGVVSVLHPEWGTPARKSRAAGLRMRLEKPR